MKNEFTPFQKISQAHSLGCGVACVASRCGLTYVEALALFTEPENAWIRGFYCSEMIEALGRAEKLYSYVEFNPLLHAHYLQTRGSIIFVGPSPYYPAGHYLLRCTQAWMNPWANFPQMIPVEAAFEDFFRGTVTHLIFEVDSELRPKDLKAEELKQK